MNYVISNMKTRSKCSRMHKWIIFSFPIVLLLMVSAVLRRQQILQDNLIQTQQSPVYDSRGGGVAAGVVIGTNATVGSDSNPDSVTAATTDLKLIRSFEAVNGSKTGATTSAAGNDGAVDKITAATATTNSTANFREIETFEAVNGASTSTTTGATAQHLATNNYSTTTSQDKGKDNGGIGIETVDNHHLLSSSNNYTWIGNHWVPPPGVPTFTVLQMRTYFQNRNVLFIGDSTGRRSYNTLFALINAEDVDDIDVASVERGIDATKKFPYVICPQEDRALYNSTFYQYICRDLNPTNGLDIMNTTIQSTLNSTMNSTQAVDSAEPGTTSKDDQSPSKKGKFDYTRLNCFGEVYDYVTGNSTYAGVLGDYDLVVITLGVWEVMRGDCSMKRRDDVHERLNMTLHALEDISNADLQIAFRTPGFHGKRVADQVTFKMIQDSNAFFDSRKKEKQSNIIQVDWGSVISKRSWNEKRISGDMPVHYGLEARLLFIQQLMHRLVLNDALS